MTPNENRHVEILAEVIYNNQLIPTLSMEDVKEFIEVDKKGMLPSMALSALATLQGECDKEIESKDDGLNHIKKVAEASRTMTRRLRWIAKRAEYAIGGKTYNQDEFDMPKYAESAESLKAEIRIQQATIASLREEVESLKGIVDYQERDLKELDCNHEYSRTMNQEYPRKCVKCGKPEGLSSVRY